MRARVAAPLLSVFLLLTFATIMLGLTGPGSAESPLPPGFSVKIQATPKFATVGDPIRLDLDITLPPGYSAEIPPVEKQLGDFTVFEFSPGPFAAGPGRKSATSASTAGVPADHGARIVAAAYRTGTLTFPPVQIRVRAPDGKQFAATSPPVRIDIQSILSGKDSELKDLKKQAEMPERTRWGLWLSILLGVAVLSAVAWRFWKRRKKPGAPVPVAPPQDLLDIAEAELRELLSGGFPPDSKVKQFYVRLSDVVKKILEAGYGIPTAERTTSEIMEDLRSGPSATAEEMERVQYFLSRCDLVKFAKYVPSPAEHDSAASDSLHILKTSRDIVARRQLPFASGAVAARPPVKESENI